jgi:hypothetical protein
MKTPINVFHVNLDDSIANKKWARELMKYPD